MHWTKPPSVSLLGTDYLCSSDADASFPNTTPLLCSTVLRNKEQYDTSQASSKRLAEPLPSRPERPQPSVICQKSWPASLPFEAKLLNHHVLYTR